MQDAFVDSIMSAIHQSQQLLGPFEAKEAAQCWREGAKVFILQLRLTVITIIFGIFNILFSPPLLKKAIFKGPLYNLYCYKSELKKYNCKLHWIVTTFK